MKRSARSWGVAALAAAAVLVPLGTTIASAAESAEGAAPAPRAVNLEGSYYQPGDGQPSAAPAFAGGEAATVSEFPPVIAGIRAGGTRPEGQTCTLSVLAPRKLLSAAHCADAAGEKSFVYGLNDLAEYKGGSGTGFQFAKATEYKKHPSYVNFDQGYDVAVVTIDRDITPLNGVYGKYATSADSASIAGKTGIAYGYGMKDANDNTRDVTLDKARLPIVVGGSSTGNCTGIGNFSEAQMICSGYSDGRVTILRGDSGGPIVVDGKIYGVGSWSSSNWNWWSVYGRLNNANGDWVKQQVGDTPTPTDHKVSVAPTSGTVQAGQVLSASVNTEAGSGGAENLTLSASGLPSGVTAGFQPSSVTAGSGSKLSFSASSTAANGTSNVTITATNSAGKTATSTFALTVQGGGTGDKHTVSVDPSNLSVKPGNYVSTTVFTGAGPNGAENLSLSASGLPSGVIADFQPSSVNAGGTAKVTFDASSSAANGSYKVTISAKNSAGVEAQASVTLVVGEVQGEPDYTLTASPNSKTIPKGTSGSVGITTASGPSGAQNISLSAENLPTGVTATFQPKSVNTGEPAKLTLEVSSTAQSVQGHSVTIVGTNAAGGRKTTTLSLTTGQPDTSFTIGSSPSSVTVKQGASGTSTISSVAGSGGAETVNLTASGAPSGVSVSFNPSSIQTGGNSTATFTVGSSVATGTYNVTVTATNSGGKTATTNVSLTVETGGTPGGVTVTLTPTSGSTWQGGFVNLQARASGGTGNITFSASGLPSGTTMMLNPSSVPQGGSTSGWFQTGFSSPTGTYNVTVTARSADGKTGTATFELTITRLGGYSMTRTAS